MSYSSSGAWRQEGAVPSPLWFIPAKEGLEDRVAKLATAVHEGVQLVFHLCCGVLGHAQFIEPRETALLVNVASLLSRQVHRRVVWLHMPVL